LGKTSYPTQGRNPRHRQIGGIIFAMSFNLTWHMSARRNRILRAWGPGIWAGCIGKIAALEKRADGAGNRYGCDFGARLTNRKWRTNHERES
jgi:hypothetical protein